MHNPATLLFVPFRTCAPAANLQFTILPMQKMRAVSRLLAVVTLLALLPAQALAQAAKHSSVQNLKITMLSTMLADEGLGEWGFAALVEADGHRILVDTGARPDTVLSNLRDLHLDLSDVREVVLTHNHDDHVGGLMTLRRTFMKKNPEALSIVHVGKGIFYS